MGTIPDWVVPGAGAVMIGGFGSEQVTELTILRVGKKYAILSDGSRVDATGAARHDGSLSRSTGTWSLPEYLHPADSGAAQAALTKKAIGRNGMKLKAVTADFINGPTTERAVLAHELIDQIITATQHLETKS